MTRFLNTTQSRASFLIRNIPSSQRLPDDKVSEHHGACPVFPSLYSLSSDASAPSVNNSSTSRSAGIRP
ncbi:MAG: hypothetical protein KJO18_02195, partial [Acidimicrobiia bacterium]|nr:hypothetical protein [Acidimicrobiia bacterium]